MAAGQWRVTQALQLGGDWLPVSLFTSWGARWSCKSTLRCGCLCREVQSTRECDGSKLHYNCNSSTYSRSFAVLVRAAALLQLKCVTASLVHLETMLTCGAVTPTTDCVLRSCRALLFRDCGEYFQRLDDYRVKTQKPTYSTCNECQLQYDIW